MLRLMLLRHAKAVHDAPTDMARPLAPEGVAASAGVGVRMAATGHVPSRILCSPARRTRETLLGILPGLIAHLPPDATIEFCPGLYNGGEQSLVNLLRAHPDAVSPLLVIGHNPTLQEAALRLAGGDPAGLRRTLAAKFPTAALAVIDFDLSSWREVEGGSGRLVAVETAGD